MKLNNSCLIGYTGTVGKHLRDKHNFNYLYNSKNIKKIINKKFKIVICSAAPGSMILANQKPKQDLNNIKKIIQSLKTIKADKFVLISTIQVFSNLDSKNNDEICKNFNNEIAYGKNRRFLEKFCEKNFEKLLIIRLPSIFGKHIKKNFIFDIINPLPSFFNIEKFKFINKKIPTQIKLFFNFIYKKKDRKYFLDRKLLNKSKEKNENKKLVKFFEKNNFVSTSLTNPKSKFQYYNLENLFNDIKSGIKLKKKYLNISTEPIYAKDIFRHLTKQRMKSNESNIYRSNMVSKYSTFWKKKKNYLYKKEEILSDLIKFYRINK